MHLQSFVFWFLVWPHSWSQKSPKFIEIAQKVAKCGFFLKYAISITSLNHFLRCIFYNFYNYQNFAKWNSRICPKPPKMAKYLGQVLLTFQTVHTAYFCFRKSKFFGKQRSTDVKIFRALFSTCQKVLNYCTKNKISDLERL